MSDLESNALAVLFLRLIPSFCLALSAAALKAQPAPVENRQLIADEFESDPIGIDPTVSPPHLAPAKTGPGPATTNSAAVDVDTRYGPDPRTGRATQGEVLTAMPSVKETSHSQTVSMDDQFVQVVVSLHLENSVDEPAEASYRLSVPEGAVASGLRVCAGERCREGLAGPAIAPGHFGPYDAAVLARGPGDGLPVAELSPLQDARGNALQLRAAPISRAAPLDITVQYLAPLTVVAGVARVHLPPRGMDPRVAPTRLMLHGEAYQSLRANGRSATTEALVLQGWEGAELKGVLSPDHRGGLRVLHYPCGKRTCRWVRALSKAAPGRPRSLILALDVSPSTTGPARNRMALALTGLLAAAPPGTTVQALMFAGRAQALITNSTPAAEVSMEAFRSALTGPDLGSATRFEAAVELAATLRKRGGGRPLLVVLGDGGVTTGTGNPLSLARERGLDVAVVNLGDRPARASLLHAVRDQRLLLLEAGEAGQVAERARDPEVMRERMEALFAPWVSARVTCASGGQRIELGPLVAGETITFKDARAGTAPRITCRGAGRRGPGSVRGRDEASERWIAAARFGPNTILSAVAPSDLKRGDQGFPDAPRFLPRQKAVAARCDRRGPSRRQSGVNSDAHPIILAHDRACAKPMPAAEQERGLGQGMPADPLLDMLRQRIIPVARGCFRRDRAGRSDYSVRAVFRFELADQEIIDARVEGPIEEGLRACLLTAVDSLHVPRFTGLLRVSYPLKTLREALPPQIELSPGTASEVDTLLQSR